MERWGQNQGVIEWPGWASAPFDARPTQVRNVDCDWHSDLRFFDCEYDVDWKSEGLGQSGTYRRKFMQIGKDENGNWVELIIVT
jgi:hypothetical protein